MSMDARNEDLDLTPEVKAKFDELVAMLARGGFGERPPRDTTFAQIEKFGHQAGRMLARAVDTEVAAQHASSHFQEEQPCPSCGEQRRPKEKPHDLPLQTSDGEVTLHEPTGHCPQCRRDFFPSADPVSP